MRRCALITGSATGVGAAAALAFARRGYDVLVDYSTSEAEANATERACREAGADAIAVRGDVADDAACRRLVQTALDRWKRLDVLVNNAGVTTFAGADWEKLDAEAFQRIFAVNLVGAFQMIRAAAPHLKASRGAVVNVSSIAGALGIGSSVPYVASKGALNSMTLHLARALAPEVRVNAVCPGLITTRWFPRGIGQEAYEKLRASYEAGAPLATACTAEDVAEAIVWLADGARTVTGEILLLDSGTHLGPAPRIPQGKPG
ncbi:MAG TPA: SDR family oxidoreductase [Anaeromyxobacteraceae bacterium]|nr:SDR family oxidoreductase [Anaeromyxobacteraceae bacterium]